MPAEGGHSSVAAFVSAREGVGRGDDIGPEVNAAHRMAAPQARVSGRNGPAHRRWDPSRDESRGAQPNESVAIAAPRRACSRRRPLTKAKVGERTSAAGRWGGGVEALRGQAVPIQCLSVFAR